jgi:hypothetical protein
MQLSWRLLFFLFIYVLHPIGVGGLGGGALFNFALSQDRMLCRQKFAVCPFYFAAEKRLNLFGNSNK